MQIDESDKLDSATLVARLAAQAPAMRAFLSGRIPAPLRGCVSEDDILQDAWIRAHRTAGNFRFTGAGSFEAWLKTIVRSQLAANLRAAGRLKRGGNRPQLRERRKSSFGGLLDDLAGPWRRPSSAVQVRDASELLNASLAALDEDRRRVLELHYIDEHPVERVAELLGVTVAGVHSLLYKAKNELRNLLGPASNFLSAGGRGALPAAS